MEGRERAHGKKEEREMGPRSVPLEGQIENPNEPAVSYLQKGKLLNRDQKPRGSGGGRPGKNAEGGLESEGAANTSAKLVSKELPVSEASSSRPFKKLQKAPEGKEEAIAQLLHKGLMPHDSLINSRGPALPPAISPPGLNSRGSGTGRSWLTGRSCTNRDKRPTSNVWPSWGGLKLGTNLEFLCSHTWSF